MLKPSTHRSAGLMRAMGALLLVVGLLWGVSAIVAGKQIGDYIWKLRGYPYDVGPELFFWARRGPAIAGLLCIAGAALLFVGSRRGSR